MPENVWRPFCSERCKLIDLGAWATEQYRVAVAEAHDSLSGAPPDEPVAPGARHKSRSGEFGA
jgi:endogenous inhibitor of DNA gyrase (YacG/DUF329 family)